MDNVGKEKYYAFISYSSQNEKWAKWLHTRLERYNIPSTLCKENPALPKRVRPVFWYKHDLAGTVLSESLARELNNSRFLIVICSPAAASSSWVNDEVAEFIKQGKADKIIPFIVDGEPHSKNPGLECFPTALRELPREKEIRGINVRTQGKMRSLVDVVATMFGLNFDSLWQRHRRRTFRLWCYRTVAIFVAILFGIFYWDYTRATYEYYADYVDCNGVPQGVIPLKEEEMARRSKLYKFEKRRIPLGEPGMWGWRLTRVLYVNSSGVPQMHGNTEYTDRYPIQEIVYSEESGAVIRVNYCDTKGKVLLRHDLSERDGVVAGFADFKASAEEKGVGFAVANATALSQGVEAKRMSNIVRYAYERDEQGYIVRQTFHSNNDYDISRSITADGDGVSGFLFTLDSLGRRVKVEFLDINGELCCNKKGVAGKEYEYDKHGNIIKARYFGINGHSANNELYWALCVSVTDENGNIIECSLFDEQGACCLHKDGYHKYESVYDSRGNIVECSFYGVDGSPCLHKEGFHKYESVYDSRGNEVERSFYGVDGSPCLHKDGYHKYESVYDSRGNIVECSYYGVDGSPCLHKEGVHKYESVYDSRGNEVERSFYGVDGSPCLHKDGFYKYKSVYDSRGNEVERSYHGIDGSPCLHKDGFHKYIIEYSTSGFYVSLIYFDDKDGLLYEKVPVILMMSSDFCKIEGLPSESIVLRYCTWEFGDGFDGFVETMNRYRLSIKEVVYMAPTGEIKSFVSDEPVMGVRLVDINLSKERFYEIKNLYLEWKKANIKDNRK